MNEMVILHINKCKAYIDFMLSQQQWSGLTKFEVERWLSNFRELAINEMLLVYKLLTNIIYFSEKDILEALKEGVHNCICYEAILARQKEANFGLSQQMLSNVLKEEMHRTCFVPLLDSDAPHESGNYMTRVLVQQEIIPSDRSMFVDRLAAEFNSGRITRLVIIDDCVGSGNQLRGFWENTTVTDNTENILLKNLCKKYNVKANYLTLFGYDQSIRELKDEFTDLDIYCVRFLTDVQRVFSEDSYIWRDCVERDEAQKLFKSLTKACGIPLYGYRNLDFAFIMHQTIPDWSLPLFWRENSDWKLLMRRKNSNA